MLTDSLKAHWPVRRLPDVARLDAGSSGWGFFLCTRKELRTGRSGAPYLHVVLQDRSGTVAGRLLEDVARFKEEFEVGEFVRAQGRADRHNQRVEMVLESIRRVNPDQDRADGFREADYVRAAPRPADEMWQELRTLIAGIENDDVRRVVDVVVTKYEDRLRVWPAAVTVHHDYRSGLLEHLLQVADVCARLADVYGADKSDLVAGAILHDIGKVEELDYELATSYSLEGNLLGHITIGVRMVNDAAAALGDVPRDVVARLAHLILSHHGSRDHGSPVEPMTVEAFILSAADDLDATLHQVRRHVSEGSGDSRFTSYHSRLGRVLLKPSGR
ncbi:MAG: HD domain-containing protein [Vicinamibacterales bacterium]